ncbi:MAG: MFS transporter [Deltaproteobacteria bacterium]|nr:MFS transporter [Deltaproteobacteria bacterium]
MPISSMSGSVMPRSRQAYLVLVFSLFLATMCADTVILPATLPVITHELGLAPHCAGYLILAYGLALAAASVIWNQKRDKRNGIWIGGAIFTLGTICSGAAVDFYTMSAARVFCGIGVALVVVSELDLTRYFLEPQTGPMALGILFSMSHIGYMIGGPLAGLSVMDGHWRLSFFVIAFIGLSLTLLLRPYSLGLGGQLPGLPDQESWRLRDGPAVLGRLRACYVLQGAVRACLAAVTSFLGLRLIQEYRLSPFESGQIYFLMYLLTFGAAAWTGATVSKWGRGRNLIILCGITLAMMVLTLFGLAVASETKTFLILTGLLTVGGAILEMALYTMVFQAERGRLIIWVTISLAFGGLGTGIGAAGAAVGFRLASFPGIALAGIFFAGLAGAMIWRWWRVDMEGAGVSAT